MWSCTTAGPRYVDRCCFCHLLTTLGRLFLFALLSVLQGRAARTVVGERTKTRRPNESLSSRRPGRSTRRYLSYSSRRRGVPAPRRARGLTGCRFRSGPAPPPALLFDCCLKDAGRWPCHLQNTRGGALFRLFLFIFCHPFLSSGVVFCKIEKAALGRLAHHAPRLSVGYYDR